MSQNINSICRVTLTHIALKLPITFQKHYNNASSNVIVILQQFMNNHFPSELLSECFYLRKSDIRNYYSVVKALAPAKAFTQNSVRM